MGYPRGCGVWMREQRRACERRAAEREQQQAARLRQRVHLWAGLWKWLGVWS